MSPKIRDGQAKFVRAVLSLEAHARGGVSTWTALLLVHAAFMFDDIFNPRQARLAGRERRQAPSRAQFPTDKLLVRAGWLHSGTSLTVLSLSTFCCASGYFYARTEGWLHWAALLGPTVALATFATAAYIRRPSTGRLPPPSEPVADGVSHA